MNEELFQEDLLKDEQILWTGQPDPNIIFATADWFLIPFSLLWGGFAIFWELAVLGLAPGVGAPKAHQAPPPFFAISGVPFVIMGLYIIFGRFIYKKWKKKNTYYAVSNKRVLILTNTWGRNLQAAYIDTIPSINKSIRSDGTGTIKFGNSSFITGMYGNTGMDFFAAAYGRDVPTFFDLPDADNVYQLVSGLRK